MLLRNGQRIFNKGRRVITTTSFLIKRSFKSEKSAVGFDNYEETYNSYTVNIPKYFNFAEDVLQEWCEKEKIGVRKTDLPAFWWMNHCGDEVKWTFQETMKLSNKLSNVLANNLSITSGDVVIVVLPRIPEWWLVNVACLKIGAILSPGTTSLTSKDLSNRLNASKAKCIITTSEVASRVDQVSKGIPFLKHKIIVGDHRKDWLPLHDLMENADDNFKSVKTKSDEPMSWFFTSGTTGLPKMTEHTHASYGLAHKYTGEHWLDLTPDDIMWNLSDTGWAKSAYSSFFAPWWQGSCVFVHHTPKFDAKETLDILTRFPISVACFPPTAYRMFLQEDLNNIEFKALRHCVSAGEPLNPEVIEKWHRKTGLTIREGYGQTEMTLSCGMFRCLEVKPGSMGKASPGYDIRVIDNDGEEVDSMVEGDIAINCYPHRPVGLFTRYVDDPERTAATHRGHYYLTGDKGYKDEDGYLWFVGRSDDVIISSGYRIGPFEVESVLIGHPAVAESAVISSPCEVRGEVVKACVVLNEEFKGMDKRKLAKELQDHVKEATAPYKYPRKVEFFESLPKTISGKIRRVELRQQEWNK